MEAVETAAIVINPQVDIDSITRRLLRHAQARKLCCLISIFLLIYRILRKNYLFISLFFFFQII